MPVPVAFTQSDGHLSHTVAIDLLGEWVTVTQAGTQRPNKPGGECGGESRATGEDGAYCSFDRFRAPAFVSGT